MIARLLKLSSAMAMIFLFLSLPVDAARKKPRKTGRKPTAAAKQRSAPDDDAQSLSFSGLKLKGQLKKPDLSYIYKRRGLRSEQIVNIPENFDNELVQAEGQF